MLRIGVLLLLWEDGGRRPPTPLAASAGRGGGERGASSQEFGCPVERAEPQAGSCKIILGALLAVDHGEYQDDIAAGLADRFHRLHRRVAGGGDVLDDHDALAL